MKYHSNVKPTDNNHKHLVKNEETGIVALTPRQQSLHNNFLMSARSFKRSLVRTIYYLASINHQKIHRMMGYKTIGEYAEKMAGFSPNQTKAFLRLARKLPDFQVVEEAVEKGSLSWTKAQEICNAVDPMDQEHWVAVASRMPLKDLKKRLRKPKNQPTLPRVKSPTEPHVEYHHLSLKLTGEQLARWHSCLEHLMKSAAKPKEEIILTGLAGMMKEGAEGSAGQPPYLIVLLECPACGQASMPTNRGEMSVPTAMLRAGYCDATVEDPSGQRRAVIPPRLRRQALSIARYSCQTPGCRNTTFLEIHHRTPMAQGGTNELANLIVLCWRCHRQLHEAEERAGVIIDQAPAGFEESKENGGHDR